MQKALALPGAATVLLATTTFAVTADGKENPPGVTETKVTLEGYLAGKSFTQVLENAGENLTRRSFLDAIQSTGTFDLGGVKLQFGEEDHQGLDEVWLTIFRDGSVQSLWRTSGRRVRPRA